MSDEKENVVVEAAAHLLAHRPRHRTEGNVQSDVEALLRAMRVGTIESHYQLGSDQADIYLPNRRTFIECKPYPKVPARDAAFHHPGAKVYARICFAQFTSHDSGAQPHGKGSERMRRRFTIRA